jgi:HlyD family secretion protein
MNKKKTRKWNLLIFGLLAIAALVYFLIPKSELGNYEAIAVKTGSITTLYSFSGNVDADRRDSYVTTMPVEIDRVYAEKGEQVSEDDTIIRLTAYGRKLKARIDGKVIFLDVKKGDVVPTGTTLYQIVDMDTLQIVIKVDEYDLSAVAVGSDVVVLFNALEGKTVSGKITDIADEATIENNISYFKATVSIPYDAQIRLGMSAEVQVKKDFKENIVAIPLQIVQFDTANKAYVMCLNADGKLEKRYLTLGINNGTDVEVITGLLAGDTFYIPEVHERVLTALDMIKRGD